MPSTILITGGAGFIGSHIADELLRRGYTVRVLDALAPQVHGPQAQRPPYLADEVELIDADMRDRSAIDRALRGADAVIHLAAAVGVGQSMYEIEHYTSVNNLGTAALLQALAERPVDRLLVASSMSIYGEGSYRDPHGRLFNGWERSDAQLHAGQWELSDSHGTPLQPIPTPESKQPAPSSVYALSKLDQERLCLIVGRAYGIPTAALRLFNVYGPRQALSNPYTGVLAIFSSRYLNGRPPRIFEDGFQQRDFVHVRDVARAFRLALETPEATGRTINIGSGQPRTIRQVAHRIGQALDAPHLQPEITQQHRIGDIRHCFADITAARRVLGYEPEVSFEEGLRELTQWLRTQPASAPDHSARAGEQLSARGLVV